MILNIGFFILSLELLQFIECFNRFGVLGEQIVILLQSELRPSFDFPVLCLMHALLELLEETVHLEDGVSLPFLQLFDAFCDKCVLLR